MALGMMTGYNPGGLAYRLVDVPQVSWWTRKNPYGNWKNVVALGEATPPLLILKLTSSCSFT